MPQHPPLRRLPSPPVPFLPAVEEGSATVIAFLLFRLCTVSLHLLRLRTNLPVQRLHFQIEVNLDFMMSIGTSHSSGASFVCTAGGPDLLRALMVIGWFLLLREVDLVFPTGIGSLAAFGLLLFMNQEFLISIGPSVFLPA
eukprot:4074872-Pleurochrysis_carterae.AAC.1